MKDATRKKIEEALKISYGTSVDGMLNIEEARKNVLMNDIEEVVFSSEEEFIEYLCYRHKHDLVLEEQAGYLTAIAAPKSLAEYKEICKEYDPQDVDEAIFSDIENSLLYVAHNGGARYTVDAIRYTGLDSFYRVAGYEHSSAIREFKPRKCCSPIEVEARPIVLNYGLHRYTMYDKPVKMLLRDAKIGYFGSSSYGVASPLETAKAVYDVIGEEHPDITFRSGSATQEYLIADFDLNDEAEANALSEHLNKDVSLGVRLSTSEVGKNACFCAFMAIIEKIPVRIGKPARIVHEGGEVVIRFENQLKELGAAFKEAEEQVEKLGMISISHPIDCLKNISSKADKAPGAFINDYALKDVLRGLEEDGLDKDCYAIDIFMAINQAVEKMRPNLSLGNYLDYMERAAELMYIDFSVYDHAFVEPKK